MPITSKSAQEIASLCDGAQKTSDGYRARCPAHGGKNTTSLHIFERDGQTLLKCHSQNCKVKDILKAIGIEPEWVNKKEAIYYYYEDENGNIVYRVKKYYVGYENRYTQEAWDPSKPGGYAETRNNVPLILYRLPRIIDAVRDGKTILILEGEKDVHTAEIMGFIATTNPGGAEKWRPEYCQVLKDADLVIIPDNDESGQKHLAQVQRLFKNVNNKPLTVINLPQFERGGDFTDWAQRGGTKEQLQSLIDEAKASAAVKPPTQLISEENSDLALHLNDKGYAKETFYNMSMILQHDDDWAGKLRFDSFLNLSLLEGMPISEITEMRIAESLGKKYGFGGNQAKVLTRAIHAASSVNAYDSLQEWVNDLPPWDGNNRLRTWMVECCGAIEDAMTGWISYVTIMQMIARARNPGCMARLVPVWEGPENKGKTSAIMILGDPWSMTFDMSMDSKEAHMAIQGCWVAELSELDTLRRTTETRLKSFISQVKDSYVPKYANYRVDHPRRTVFFGTTNENSYLQGETGNTRWLPIRTEWFNLDKLRECRDQLFAEAVSTFQESPNIEWWEEPPIVRDAISLARDQRRILNVYEDDLKDWLDGKPISRKKKYDYDGRPIDPPTPKAYDEVTWPDIAEDYFQFENREKWGNKVLQAQVGSALQSLGWRRARVLKGEGDNAKQVKCWKRPS